MQKNDLVLRILMLDIVWLSREGSTMKTAEWAPRHWKQSFQSLHIVLYFTSLSSFLSRLPIRCLMFCLWTLKWTALLQHRLGVCVKIWVAPIFFFFFFKTTRRFQMDEWKKNTSYGFPSNHRLIDMGPLGWNRISYARTHNWKSYTSLDLLALNPNTFNSIMYGS